MTETLIIVWFVCGVLALLGLGLNSWLNYEAITLGWLMAGPLVILLGPLALAGTLYIMAEDHGHFVIIQRRRKK